MERLRIYLNINGALVSSWKRRNVRPYKKIREKLKQLFDLGEEISIQTPILNRLRDMFWLNLFCARQIGNGPGNLQDFILRAGGETQFLDGHLEQFFAFITKWAILFDLPVTHLGVGEDRGGESFLLDEAALSCSGFDLGGSFLNRVRQEFGRFQGRDLQMNINPVQQRPGNF